MNIVQLLASFVGVTIWFYIGYSSQGYEQPHNSFVIRLPRALKWFFLLGNTKKVCHAIGIFIQIASLINAVILIYFYAVGIDPDQRNNYLAVLFTYPLVLAVLIGFIQDFIKNR